MTRRAFRLAALGSLVCTLVPGCKMTPEEIQRIQLENELLRKEIQVIRENCEYYQRTLELEVEPERPGEP